MSPNKNGAPAATRPTDTPMLRGEEGPPIGNLSQGQTQAANLFAALRLGHECIEKVHLWLKVFLHVFDELIKRQIGEACLALALKVLRETAPYLSTGVWIAEDKLLQSETGVRTDNQERAFRKLVMWGILQREPRNRGFEYRMQVDPAQWTAPEKRPCERLPDRGQYIEHRQPELEFEIIERFKDELGRKIIEYGFQSASQLPIPHGEGSREQTAAPIPHGEGCGAVQPRNPIPHGEGLATDEPKISALKADVSPLHSLTVSDPQRLNVNRSSAVSDERYKRCSKQKEDELFERLKAVLHRAMGAAAAKSELANWGGEWRWRFRYWSDEGDRAMGQLECALRDTTQKIDNAAAFLTLEMMTYVGKERWDEWQSWKRKRNEGRTHN